MLPLVTVSAVGPAVVVFDGGMCVVVAVPQEASKIPAVIIKIRLKPVIFLFTGNLHLNVLKIRFQSLVVKTVNK